MKTVVKTDAAALVLSSLAETVRRDPAGKLRAKAVPMSSFRLLYNTVDAFRNMNLDVVKTSDGTPANHKLLATVQRPTSTRVESRIDKRPNRIKQIGSLKQTDTRCSKFWVARVRGEGALDTPRVGVGPAEQRKSSLFPNQNRVQSNPRFIRKVIQVKQSDLDLFVAPTRDVLVWRGAAVQTFLGVIGIFLVERANDFHVTGPKRAGCLRFVPFVA